MKSRFAVAAAMSFAACAPRAAPVSSVPAPSVPAPSAEAPSVRVPERKLVTVPILALQCGDRLEEGGTVTDPVFFNGAQAEFQAEKDMVVVHVETQEGSLTRGGPACGFMAFDVTVNAETGDLTGITTRPDRTLLVVCAPEGDRVAEEFTAKGQLRIEPRDGQPGDKTLSDVSGKFADLSVGSACIVGPFAEERMPSLGSAPAPIGHRRLSLKK